MGQARDEAGNIWETDAQGNAVRMIQAASAGRVFSLPPNPKEVRQEARAEEDQQMQREAAERADKNAQRLAKASERQADAVNKPTEFQSKSAGFLGRMMQAEHDFGLIPEGERGGRSVGRKALHDMLPGLENTLVNSTDRQKADQAVENFIAASLRQESGAAISSGEFERQYKIFYPAAGDSPEVIAQKAAARKQAIEGFRIAAGPLADDAAASVQKAGNEVPDPTTGADLKPPPNAASPPDLPPENGPIKTAASGQRHTTYDARTSSQIDAMINAGASKGMIDAVLKRQDFPVVSPSEWTAIQGWRAKNPGKKYFGANISHTDDLSLMQRAAANPVATFGAKLADTATAGTLGALAGPQAQGAVEAASALNPNASVTGDVAGGVIGAMGAEGAIAARAPTALARYAPRIADALYGGALGFNTAQEGEGGVGALEGAGAGLAGGVIGQRLLGGLGRATRGVTDPAVQYLRQRGIPLTVGQAVGSGGLIGRGVKKTEDALTSLPFVGNMVEARRMEGLRGFNQAAFNEAGAPIGVNPPTGAAGVQQLRQGVGEAYDNALGPVQIDSTNPAFLEDLQGVVNAANAIPNVNGAREAAAASLDNRILGATDPDSGLIDGRSFQEAYRGLARTGRERANSDYGHEVGQVMRQGQDALTAALEAQNPGAFTAFRTANSANRNTNILAEAVNRAKNAEDEIFTPAQLNLADTQSARRLTGPLASASGDRPFYELSNAGQSVLPSKLPDSGTWTRALVGGGATGLLGGGGAALGGGDGAAAGAGTGLGLTLMLAAGGSRPAQRILVEALTARPDRFVRAGNYLVNRSGIGGWTGAGALTPLLVGQ